MNSPEKQEQSDAPEFVNPFHLMFLDPNAKKNVLPPVSECFLTVKNEAGEIVREESR